MSEGIELMKARIGTDLIGLPVGYVRNVFVVEAVTPVPLAPPGVCGLVNHGGRVLCLLSLDRPDQPATGMPGEVLAINLDFGGHAAALRVDDVESVAVFNPLLAGTPDAAVAARWSGTAKRTHLIPKGVLIEIDIPALLEQPIGRAA